MKFRNRLIGGIAAMALLAGANAFGGAHGGARASKLDELPARSGDWSPEEIRKGREQLVRAFDAAWIRNATTPGVRARLTAFSFAALPAFTRVFLKQMETIPIDPEGSFREAIRAGLESLQAGRVVLIFPEGPRTHPGKLREFRPGVALLSLLAQRPIVPFRTLGMFGIFPRDRGLPRLFGWKQGGADRLEVRFGSPIVPPLHDPERTWEQAQEILRQLQTAVEAL